jgi:hypothetical protein
MSGLVDLRMTYFKSDCPINRASKLLVIYLPRVSSLANRIAVFCILKWLCVSIPFLFRLTECYIELPTYNVVEQCCLKTFFIQLQTHRSRFVTRHVSAKSETFHLMTDMLLEARHALNLLVICLCCMRNIFKHYGTKRRAWTHMLMAVLWVVAPCSLVEVYQRFRGPCCLHHQGESPYSPP